MEKYKNVFLSIGSNLGDKIVNIIESLIKINLMKDTYIIDVSSFYFTEPVGFINQPNFINIGVYIKTKLKPYELLKKINEIENDLHRERIRRWDKRTIDIDIIFYENIKMKRNDLNIPHKQYRKRNFVLEPMYEIYHFEKRKKRKISNGKVYKKNIYRNIAVSACMAGIDTKYDGMNNNSKLIRLLSKSITFIPLCPEQLGGMSTPRNSVEIYNGKVKDKYNNEYTQKFKKGAEETLKIMKLTKCDCIILKSKSPSCGYGEIYDGSFTKKLITGNGITAEFLMKKNIKIIKY